MKNDFHNNIDDKQIKLALKTFNKKIEQKIIMI